MDLNRAQVSPFQICIITFIHNDQMQKRIQTNELKNYSKLLILEKNYNQMNLNLRKEIIKLPMIEIYI